MTPHGDTFFRCLSLSSEKRRSHLAVDCERDRKMSHIIISLVLLGPHSTDFSLGIMCIQIPSKLQASAYRWAFPNKRSLRSESGLTLCELTTSVICQFSYRLPNDFPDLLDLSPVSRDFGLEFRVQWPGWMFCWVLRICPKVGYE